MYNLEDHYQDIVIAHSSRPRNFRKLEEANRIAEGFNPLCGDQINLYLAVTDGVIAEVGFEGKGCAISTASVIAVGIWLSAQVTVKPALPLSPPGFVTPPSNASCWSNTLSATTPFGWAGRIT